MAGNKDEKPSNDLVKNLLTWAIIAVVLMSIFNHYASVTGQQDELSYSDFLDQVHFNGDIRTKARHMNFPATPRQLIDM